MSLATKTQRHEAAHIFILLLVASLAAAEDYTVSVTTVTVWVKAVDKDGKPVSGLKPESFRVFEDGTNREIACFEEIRQSTVITTNTVETPAPPRQGATESVRQVPAKQFILFLDLFNTSQPEYLMVRRAMFDFLKKMEDRKAEVEVAVLLPTKKLGILVPFTSEYKRVETKLKALRANAQRDQQLLNRKHEILTLFQVARGIEGEVIHEAYQLARGFTRQEEKDTLFTLEALESLGNFISQNSPGTSSAMLFVSGGISYEPGRVYYDLVDRQAEKYVEAKADPTEWATMMPAATREKNINIRDEIRKSVGYVNRKNIVVYSLNTRGMVQPDASNIYTDSVDFAVTDRSYLRDYQDSLDQIAEESGGLSFKNTLNFPRAFDTLVNDLSNNYEICYNAPPHEKRGQFHKISIKTSVPNIHLRYRSGYVD